MKIQKKLDRIYWFYPQIHAGLAELDKLSALADRADKIRMEPEKELGNNLRHVGDTVAELAMMQDELCDQIQALIGLWIQVSDGIRSLRDWKERLILEKRYLCHEDWSKIAEDLRMTESKVREVHNKGKKNLEMELV